MAIQRVMALLAFALLGISAQPVTRTSDALSAWFQSGRCAAFNRIASPKVPYARDDREYLEWMSRFSARFQPSGNPTYIYDARHRSVFRSIGQDSSGSRTWRAIGPPPAHVLQSDLSRLATTSGIHLGSSAAVVVQKLGRPYIVLGCGLQRYAYLIDRQVGGNSLEFTIQNGRVIEIFQTYGD